MVCILVVVFIAIWKPSHTTPLPGFALEFSQSHEHKRLPRGNLNEMLPHCSITGSHLPSTRHRISISVGQTVCFNGDNSTSDLQTLTLTQLEQYHPISQRYRFALPEVETNCICECSASSAICQASDYAFGQCDPTGNPSTVCHRTFFANQPTTGCMAASQPDTARLCCDLKFQPYQNRTFTALKLGAPLAFAVFKYAAFSWIEGRWSEEDSRTVSFDVEGRPSRLPIDSVKQYRLSLNTLGKTADSLSPGMYFVENLLNGYGEVMALEELNEVTDFDGMKLGWFRQDDNGQYMIKNGDTMIDRMHSAKVENCKHQKYTSTLDAKYYINKNSNSSTKFDLPRPVQEVFLWIKEVQVHDEFERHVNVTAKDATFDITITSPDLFSFIHNVTKVESFTGKIVIDSRSNSILRLNVFNATGILHGYIRRIDDDEGRYKDGFSVPVPEGDVTNKSIELRIRPYVADKYYTVCLQPEDGLEEMCQAVEAVIEARSVPEMSKSWTDNHSNCLECNQITFIGIMQYFTSIDWINSASSLKENLIFIVWIIMLGVVLYVVYIILKCVYPLLKCCFCPATQYVQIVKR